MNYLNILSNDLYSIILSYLGYYDLLKLSYSKINFNILFVLKFPKLFNSNNQDDYLKHIYTDLLFINTKYPNFIIHKKKSIIPYLKSSIFSPVIIPINGGTIPSIVSSASIEFPSSDLNSSLQLQLQSYRDTYSNENYGKINEEYLDIYYIKELNKETIKYLLLNDNVPTDIRYIAYIDDIDIFIRKKDNLTIDYYIFFKYNSYNILKYILENILTEDIRRKILLDIMAIYNDNIVNLDITKMLIKYLNIDNLSLLLILEHYNIENNNLDSFIFILNNIDQDDIDIGLIIYTLTSIFRSESNSLYIRFKLIYDKFIEFFEKEDIIDLYINILRVYSLYNEDINFMKMMTHRLKVVHILSHNKVIENEFGNK